MLRRSLTALGLATCWLAANATVSLSKDWPSPYLPNGGLVPDEQYEPAKMDSAAKLAADKRNATLRGDYRKPDFGLGFRLHIGDVKYYIKPAMFMAGSHPQERCTPKRFDNVPIYQCEEGQRYAYGCHLIFLDANFAEAGFHTLAINEPYRYFCNAMPSLGVANKDRNELLVTVQYFPIDRKAASKVSEIGSGWTRMTLLFRVKAVDGKIVVEQDDRCLGNPNRVETIPEARKLLKRCEAQAAAGR